MHRALLDAGVALGIGLRDLLVHARARVATLSPRPQQPEERSGWDGVVDPPSDPRRTPCPRPLPVVP